MKENTLGLLGTLFVVAFVIAVVAAIPLGQIWAFNTLFGTNIEYSLKNWLAVVILSLFWVRLPQEKQK